MYLQSWMMEKKLNNLEIEIKLQEEKFKKLLEKETIVNREQMIQHKGQVNKLEQDHKVELERFQKQQQDQEERVAKLRSENVRLVEQVSGLKQHLQDLKTSNYSETKKLQNELTILTQHRHTIVTMNDTLKEDLRKITETLNQERKEKTHVIQAAKLLVEEVVKIHNPHSSPEVQPCPYTPNNNSNNTHYVNSSPQPYQQHYFTYPQNFQLQQPVYSQFQNQHVQ